MREILHHGSLHHPFIVGLREVFLTQKHLAIAMEYAAGGDMFQHLLRQVRAGPAPHPLPLPLLTVRGAAAAAAPLRARQPAWAGPAGVDPRIPSAAACRPLPCTPPRSVTGTGYKRGTRGGCFSSSS